MYVIDMEDLEKEGVSLSQVQGSLEIQCFDKIFHRSSDLPKKFKDKAFNVCKKFTDTGLESFITETSYSYTIWKEIKSVKEEKNSQNFSEIKPEQSSPQNNHKNTDHLELVSFQNHSDSPLSNKENHNNDNDQMSNENMWEKSMNLATLIAAKDIEIETLEEEFDDSVDLATSIATQEATKEIEIQEIEIEKSDEEFNNESETIGKYRGLVVDKKTLFRIAKAKKRVRTYRGVTY